MAQYKRETVSEKIGHVFDANVFLMLLLCVSYIMCYKFLITDVQKQSTFVSAFTIVLYVTTAFCFIYACYQSINVLRIYHPKKIRPLVLLFLLFLAFFSIYFATYEVYFRGGSASYYFMIFVELMMKLFSILFFSIAISLTSYAMLIKSKKDIIKMIIMSVFSLYLMIELHILAINATITTYTSKIELLAIYFLAISIYNITHIVLKPKDEKIWEIDTFVGIGIYVIGVISVLIRDYNKIINFFYENIFRETYDLILHYTLMIVLQLVFMILVIKNYKMICKKLF